MKEPKDLKVKIGTKDEAYWTMTKTSAEESILQHHREIEINKSIVTLADKKIAKEQR